MRILCALIYRTEKRPAYAERLPLVYSVHMGEKLSEPSGDLPSGSSIIIHMLFMRAMRFSDNHQLFCSHDSDQDVLP